MLSALSPLLTTLLVLEDALAQRLAHLRQVVERDGDLALHDCATVFHFVMRIRHSVLDLAGDSHRITLSLQIVLHVEAVVPTLYEHETDQRVLLGLGGVDHLAQHGVHGRNMHVSRLAQFLYLGQGGFVEVLKKICDLTIYLYNIYYIL